MRGVVAFVLYIFLKEHLNDGSFIILSIMRTPRKGGAGGGTSTASKAAKFRPPLKRADADGNDDDDRQAALLARLVPDFDYEPLMRIFKSIVF